ncbi:MAG: hypothetical protein NVSMB6_23460 [Burkholderiaceae bacterium]
MKTTAVTLTLVGAALLGGCGGGGSSSPAGPAAAASAATGTSASTTVAPATSPPVGSTNPAAGPVIQLDAAITELYNINQHFGNDATDPNGAPVKLGRDYVVGKPGISEGLAVKTIGITNTVTNSSGVVTRTFGQTDYFQDAPYKLISRTFTTSPLYEVATNQQPLPATAKAGDSGKFYDSIIYSSVSKSAVVANAVQTWQVTPDTDKSLSFCINSSTQTVGVPGVTTKSDCYKITVPGHVTTTVFNG